MGATGIWNHAAQASMSLATSQTSNAKNATSTASGDPGDATISANDFLSLLVTEMQNQDPTADTDPNEYINQLVNVNSLEQLIQINQTLSSAATTTGATPGPGGGTSTALQAIGGHQVGSAPAGGIQAAPVGPAPAPGGSVTAGNLSAPAPNPAAERVAQSLTGLRTNYTPSMSRITQ
jgi:flagellar basal-body rod modification protein FlgD